MFESRSGRLEEARNFIERSDFSRTEAHLESALTVSNKRGTLTQQLSSDLELPQTTTFILEPPNKLSKDQLGMRGVPLSLVAALAGLFTIGSLSVDAGLYTLIPGAIFITFGWLAVRYLAPLLRAMRD